MLSLFSFILIIQGQLKLAGGHARHAAEDTGEILRIIKGEGVRDLGEIVQSLTDKLLCPLDADAYGVGGDGLPRLLTEEL